MPRPKRHRGMTVTKLVLPKGLPRHMAVVEAVRLVGGDFRGFSYDRKTGKTTVC